MGEENSSSTNGPSPKDIRQVDPVTLGITWTDGHESVYGVRHLRENCPCAHCIDEWTGAKRIAPGSIPDSIRPVKLHSVGLYAIQIAWNDGHDTGLYSHAWLRKLCQCGECKSEKKAS
ncbi:hypothetical protein UR09_04830 [Candidatus Nitromaritima sp. SCGC AAA799-A02]|nr:hypothetical protein UR09_04830 [Candidatus Nitromaritima sp. SCGC AAA799-A02]